MPETRKCLCCGGDFTVKFKCIKTACCSKSCSTTYRQQVEPLSERGVALFWNKVNKQDDGCWIWTGKLTTHGYGTLKRLGDSYAAHRYSWLITRGPIPDGLNVLHKCDVPTCVNPEHLFLGTQADNIRDMVEKGRMWSQKDKERAQHIMDYARQHQVGEAVRTAKLTEGDVLMIRERSAAGATLKELATEFNVTACNIGFIVRGITWKHLLLGYTQPRPTWKETGDVGDFVSTAG